MIITMPNTNTGAIARKIDELHAERGEAANDRVLTLLISTAQSDLEQALEVANAVSREHPCRVIAIVPDASAEADSVADSTESQATDLDAEVRFGADAGAGEVIILRPRRGLINHADTLVIPLLVPDIPIVTWWPTNPPANPSEDPLGAMSATRITDALRADDTDVTFAQLQRNWGPNDIDLSWTRLTIWRAMLATMIDQPPHLPVTAVKVTGQSDYLPVPMLATWLEQSLNVPVEVETSADATAVTGVYLTREDGVISLERHSQSEAVISQPGQNPQPVAMPLRTLEDCMSEELRRIDPDEIYAEVVKRDLKR